MLLLLGVQDRAVMDVMGWSGVAMKQRYMHVTEASRRDIANQDQQLLLGRQLSSYSCRVDRYVSPSSPNPDRVCWFTALDGVLAWWSSRRVMNVHGCVWTSSVVCASVSLPPTRSTSLAESRRVDVGTSLQRLKSRDVSGGPG